MSPGDKSAEAWGRLPAWVAWAALLLYLAVGAVAFDDYGLSYDEQVNRTNGAVSAVYVNVRFRHVLASPALVADKVAQSRRDDALFASQTFNPAYNEDALRTYEGRHYGVWFEVVLIGLEAFLRLEDSRAVFLMRHACTFLAFVAGVLTFYLLLRDRFRSRAAGLGGACLLVLTPMIFAHSFYNSKDSVFLSFFVVATWTLVRWLEAPSVVRALWHAVASAAVIDLRILGVFMPALSLALAGVALAHRDRLPLQCRWRSGLLAYLIALPVLTVAGWPYLWEDPVGRFWESWRMMTHYPWHGQVLYLGAMRAADQLPWHYLPVWMLVTIPIGYTAAWLAGVGVCLRRLGSIGWRLYRTNEERWDLIQLLIVLIPILAVVVLRPVLLDGWRHWFFLYPAFVALAVLGLATGWRWLWAARRRLWPRVGLAGVVIAVMLQVGCLLRFMVQNHPHQQVYFNALAGRDPNRWFELDYWGLSYRQALEYVLQHDASPVIRVAVANYPGELNARVLERTERQRLRYVPLEDAEYFLSNFRWHPGDYPFGREVFSISVGRNKIMAVYRLVRERADGRQNSEL